MRRASSGPQAAPSCSLWLRSRTIRHSFMSTAPAPALSSYAISTSANTTTAVSGGVDFSEAMAAQSAGQPVPPLFSAAPGTSEKVSINLDDIFADCFFEGGQQPQHANKAAVAAAAAAAAAAADKEVTDGSDEDDDGTTTKASATSPAASSSHNKRSRTASTREMTEQQRDERRERNREHAKRSRVRKKFLLESLQQSVNALQFENDKLRVAIRDKLGEPLASELLANCGKMPAKSNSLIAKSPSDATRILDDPDYSLVKALQTAQQNFVITDPSLPDNPIVFASHGFLTLTGYSLDNVLGRNCRFLQGPRTDPRAVAKIRKAVEDGYDTSVCLLNYRIDGSTFYNQFFVAPLRDGDGNVVNYVGVQCQVSDAFAQAIARDEQLPPI